MKLVVQTVLLILYDTLWSILEETVRERDIGVIISNTLKPAQQCLGEDAILNLLSLPSHPG